MTLPVSPVIAFGKGGTPPFSAPNGGQIGGVVEASRVLMLPLPEITPIPSAQEFAPEGHIATSIVEGGVIPNIAVDVPAGNLFVIRGFSTYINNMLTTTDVAWSILVNGNPVPGWSNITMFPRQATFVGNNFDTMVRGQGAAKITVVFRNRDGGSYDVGASLAGWHWPATADQQWKTLGA